MSTITFTGLASGLDTGSLIDQLVAAEQAKANVLASRQSDLDAQKSIVSSFVSALSSLGTLARGMDTASEVQPRTVSLSDSRLSMAVSSSATAGSHDLRVKQLALAKVTRSTGFATSTGTGIVGNGGVNITVAGVTKSVSWNSSDSLESIASKINAADAGVNAAVLYDGSVYRIMVTAKNTGTAAAPTFTDSGSTGNRLEFAVSTNVVTAAQDAILNVNGLDITRSSNVISDAIAGSTITLNSVHGATEAATKASIGLDQKALTEKVKAFVAAYNAVNSALHVQLDYTGTTKGTSTLFGDPTLRQLQTSLAGIATSAYGGSNLGALGITRDKTGAMTLDETKLAAAVSADSDAISGVFVSGGFATALGNLADMYTASGTGLFAAKTQSIADRRKGLQQQIDRINLSADALRTRLEKQFTALEKAVSALQSQASYLAGVLK